MERRVSVERLMVEVRIERSYQKLWRAMALSHTILSVKTAKGVLDALIKVNSSFWPKLG